MALIPLKEWCGAVGISPATARQKIARGQLPAQKMGRDWFIEDSAENIDHRTEGLSKRWEKNLVSKCQ